MGSVALDLAIVAAIAWLAVAVVPSGRRLVAVPAMVTAGLALWSVGALAVAMVRVDPSLVYVARHTSTSTPLPYRVAGVWGGMEGSLLFWAALVATVFAVAVVRTERVPSPSPHRAGLSAVGAVTSLVFLTVGRVQAPPFATLDVPTGDGRGLLAVLQHPAMVYHPPILYTGLALLGVPFAITVAALWRRELDRVWLAAVTPWLRASWLVLAVGIVAGSQWAYAELGWGGLWAWDPVENAALLPWLGTTVALHAGAAARATGRLTVTTAAAIAGSFCLMVSGVYVTRSGTTGSIHAFAESPAIGRPLLAFAAAAGLVSVAGIVRYGLRDGSWPAWRRDHALAVHSFVGAVGVLAIAFGTLWPVVDGFGWTAADGAREIVRPDYYHRTLAPVVVVTLAGMSIGPELRWSGGRRPGGRTAAGAAIGAVGTVGLAWWLSGPSAGGLIVLVAAGAAIGAAAGSVVAEPASVRRRRRAVGIALAHGGFALVILGAVAASSGDDRQYRLDAGERVEDGGWVVELERLETGVSDRYEFVRAHVVVDAGGSPSRHRPELRAYEDQRVPTAESSIAGSVRGDTIVVLDAVERDASAATVTVRTRPLMPWVWVGAAATVLGGAVAMLGRPRRASPTEPGATPRRAATATPR